MKFDYVLGVDPGAHGAIAILSRAGRLVWVDDMPTQIVKRGKRKVTEVDVIALAKMANTYGLHTCVAYVEKVGARPGQGVSSMFAFGRSVGQVEGALVAAGIEVKYVSPLKWKSIMNAAGEKKNARARAAGMYPQDAKFFARVKDDGRADASLIAAYGRRIELEDAR